MITDRERKNREELFKLMQENPELPVVAMVDSEIVQDEGYSRWMGAWGSSSIEEYFIGEERIHFREEDDFDEVEETLTDGQVCYAAHFDQDEHIEMWISARHSGTRGVPSIRELVKDAEDIDAMLKELAEALFAAELEAEGA